MILRLQRDEIPNIPDIESRYRNEINLNFQSPFKNSESFDKTIFTPDINNVYDLNQENSKFNLDNSEISKMSLDLENQFNNQTNITMMT